MITSPKLIIMNHSDAKAVGCEGMCHKSQGNRRIEVNRNLKRLKGKARERLLSEPGLYNGSKCPVEVEAVKKIELCMIANTKDGLSFKSRAPFATFLQ